MKPVTVPAAAVASLFLERQQLDRPRGRALTAANLARLVEDTGGLQLDSINVVDRGHYLTAWSRFGPFDRARFDALVYRDRVLFEFMAHVACLVPAAHLPAWRHVMLAARERAAYSGRWLRRHPRIADAVLDAIAREGPKSSSDFEHVRPRGAGKGWWNWKPATHALARLHLTGQLMVVGREHFEKRYDLFERFAPDWANVEPLSEQAFDRWHVRRSLHAMGVATEVDLRMYLTWPRVPATRRRPLVAAMLREGELVEVHVEHGGRGRWLALAEDLPALARAARRRAPSRGATLLSPFDSFLWHRERTKRLFGYDYRLEVYVPGHLRTHGYYTLPILLDGQLVGRADLKLHRASATLEARRVHFEPWVVRGEAPPVWGEPLARDAVLAGTADTLRSLAEFLGATRVKLTRAAPATFGPPLRRALGDAPARPRAAREPAGVA